MLHLVLYPEIVINLKIKNFIFKDSFLFLNKSLDYLTKTIDDEDRISLKQEFGESYKLLTKKGIYPYDHFDNIKNVLKQKYLITQILKINSIIIKIFQMMNINML